MGRGKRIKDLEDKVRFIEKRLDQLCDYDIKRLTKMFGGHIICQACGATTPNHLAKRWENKEYCKECYIEIIKVHKNEVNQVAVLSSIDSPWL